MQKQQQRLIKSLVVAASLAGVGAALAQDQRKTPDQQTQERAMRNVQPTQAGPRDQDQIDIYGHELMTDQELEAYQTRLREANTLQERNRIRAEHREQMEARAKDRSLKLMDGKTPGASGTSGSRGANGASGSSGAGGGGKK